MRKLTPTLTQSGLLAVLLQRQRYKISQLAWRRAQRNQMRAALWSTSPGRGGRLRHPCPSAIRAEHFVGYLPRRS